MLERNPALGIEDEKILQEKCSLVAIYTPIPTSQFDTAWNAAIGVQHRGLHGAGFAQETKKGFKTHTGKGHLNQVFSPTVVRKRRLQRDTRWTLFHTRYGTSGNYDDKNIQPCVATASDGTNVAVIHNGEFPGTDQLRRSLNRPQPKGASDTYLFTRLLAQNKKGAWSDALVETLKGVSGAYSLVVGCDEGLLVARDSHGIRPLVMGNLNNSWVIASETSALSRIGVDTLREISPGEIVRFGADGITTLQASQGEPRASCVLEMAYFSRPDSKLPKFIDPDDGTHPERWISYSLFRQRCGEILADEAPIPGVSFIVGIPDSGIPVATGFAARARVPYYRYIMRERYSPDGQERTFMRDDNRNKIKIIIGEKLVIITDPEIWEDKIVGFGEDSIIRGDVAEKITRTVLSLGAREVHWRVAFPPVTHTCHLGVSLRTLEELIAA